MKEDAAESAVAGPEVESLGGQMWHFPLFCAHLNLSLCWRAVRVWLVTFFFSIEVYIQYYFFVLVLGVQQSG